MTSLTPEDEKQIRTRAAAATDGPWATYYENPQSDYARLIDIAADLHDTGHGYRCRRYIGQLESGQIDNDPSHKEWDADQDNDQSAADAEFIAHARQDVPALLAEIDQLRGELAARPTRAAVLREAAQITDALPEQYDDLDAMKAAGIIGPHTMAGAISTELRVKAIAAERDQTPLRELAQMNGPDSAVAHAVPEIDRLRDELAARPTRADGAVAFRAIGSRALYCLAHNPGRFLVRTADDLPDGGICTDCGRDVLAVAAERGETQGDTCGAELTPRSGTRPCVLPTGHAGHAGHHQDQHTNTWPNPDGAA